MEPTFYTVTREVQFCAGHRIYGHAGRCANIHGHNYRAALTYRSDRPRTADDQAAQLDRLGMVVDFGDVKAVDRWIDRNWDHAFVWHERDPVCIAMFCTFESDDPAIQSGPETAQLKNYRLPYNPTAENMARHLMEKAPGILEGAGCEDVTLWRVQLWETPKCSTLVEL